MPLAGVRLTPVVAPEATPDHVAPAGSFNVTVLPAFAETVCVIPETRLTTVPRWRYQSPPATMRAAMPMPSAISSLPEIGL